jgi:hypothetical protein
VTDPQPVNPDPVLAGIDRLRETAKWLIGAYAAVGAAIIAGLQLTSLGKVESHTRFWIGAIAVAVALIAVVAGISKIATVLAPVKVEAADLGLGSDAEKLVQATPTLLKGQAASLVELQSEYETALSEFQGRRAAARGVFGDPAERTAAEAAAEEARSRMMALFGPLDGMRKLVLFEKVQRRYDDAKHVLGVAVVVIIVGVITFAWAANPSEESQEQAKARQHGPTLEAPSLVTVSVSKIRPSLAVLRKRLGTNCNLSEVRALIVGGTAAAPEVVTLPDGYCKIERFTASENIGIVLSTESH